MLSTIKHKTTILQPTYWLLMSLALLVGLATATIVHAALAQSATPTGGHRAIINVRSGAGMAIALPNCHRAQIEIGRNAAGDWLRLLCCQWTGVLALLQLHPAGQDVNSLPVVESAASAPSALSAAPPISFRRITMPKRKVRIRCWLGIVCRARQPTPADRPRQQ